jgi:predicted TPR repeat methyltransferase
MSELLTEEQPSAADACRELTVSQALSLAMELHQSGQVDGAEALYARILEAEPENPDAMHYLGVARVCRGAFDAGLELIERSLAMGPERADRYSNLGNVLLAKGRISQAADAYRKAISIDFAHTNAHLNLGVILGAQRRFDEAAGFYKRAIEIDPDFFNAHHNFGNLYLRQGNAREAVACYLKALALQPRHAQIRKSLGYAYSRLGQLDKAAEVYREWLAQEADDPGARVWQVVATGTACAKHLLAACSGTDVPERASDAYIESEFDAFADTFEARLGHLDYRAPQLVADALARAVSAPSASLITLDAGCGTGLCASLVKPYASRLHGVDLSARMLEEAGRKGIYDELTKAELTDFVSRHANAFDLIVSADTLVYFGVLVPVFRAAYAALRARGLLIFSVEEMRDAEGGAEYRLQPHGRYCHARAYVESALKECGFGLVAIERAVLRMECGMPVGGLVVTARADAVGT